MTHQGPPESEHPEPTPSLGEPSLLTMLWRHKSLLALGIVLGLVGGALYYARLEPVYQSSAQVLVVKKRPDALPMPGIDARLSYFEDYLGTHQVLIRSPLIVSEAVKKGNLRQLPSFAGTDPTGAIIGALTITRDTKEGGATNILILSYRGRNPEDCGVVLSAVIGSYKDFLDKTYRDVSKETAKLVTQARDVLDKQLKKKEAAVAKFRHDHPSLFKRKEGGNLRQERLVSLQAKALLATDRRAEIEQRLGAYQLAQEKGRPLGELLGLLSESSSATTLPTRAPGAQAPNASEGKDPLLPLLLQERLLTEDFGADHPKVRSVKRQIAFVRKHHPRAFPSSEMEKSRRLTERLIQVRLRSLSQELISLQAQEKVLVRLASAELEEARKLSDTENRGAHLRADLARTQQLFDSVLKRLQEINLVKDMGGYDAQAISPPGPGARVGPRATPIFSAALFLGLLCGVGLAYLAEFSDKSFRTPEEIRRRLGLPLVGYIPMLRVDAAAAEPGALAAVLYTHHHAKSPEAEAYRGVRTAVLFSTRRDGGKVIQVTSPEMADGKTTLVANLAVSLAQSGKRVILVDADLRRPRVHKIFGLGAERGLASAIAGEHDVASGVQQTQIPGLSIMPSGPIPLNPAELLTSARFGEVVKALDEQYDFVLIDTPPLLAVTDPSVVVPSVDGVLLVLRMSRHVRPKAERARDMLGALGANVLGVVVNGMNARGNGGRGYEQYSYGYTSSYPYYAEDADVADSPPSQSVKPGPDGSAG
jgi:capsular exopolysaccharide synthesis family protein